MKDAQSLEKMSLKELAEVAASLNLSGWRRMKKTELRAFLIENNALRSDSPAPKEQANEPPTPPVVKKRGRPRKIKPTAELPLLSATTAAPTPALESVKVEESAPEAEPSKPKRVGRPRRKKEPEQVPAATVEVQTSAPEAATETAGEAPAPKKRGRRKTVKTAEAPATTSEKPEEVSSPALAPATPESSPVESKTEESTEQPKRKRRGRTPKNQGVDSEGAGKQSDDKAKKSRKRAVVESTETPEVDEDKAKKQAEVESPETPKEGDDKVKKSKKRASAESDDAKAKKATKRTVDEPKTTAVATPSPEDKSEVKDVAEPSVKRSRKRKSKKSEGEQNETPKSADEAASKRGRNSKTKSGKSESSAFSLGRREKSDRLALMVCDPYWLHACWEITPRLNDRVRSAMGRHWHTADLVLRVYRVDREPQIAMARREHVVDVEIKPGVDNWYVQVDNPPSAFFVELGYRSRDNQFFTLISSNTVETPQRFIHDVFSRPNFGAVNYYDPASHMSPGDAYYRDRSPRFFQPSRSLDVDVDYGSGGAAKSSATPLSIHDEFSPDQLNVAVDAEVVIRGKVSPGAKVKVKDEPIRLGSDGSFSVRFNLPERRHVFPVVATTFDDSETQTVILAIDRNTKKLDSVFKEDEE